MGTYAIDSAQSTYTPAGTASTAPTLTSSQLWEMVGVTPMIGVNDASDEVFEPSDASQLLAFAEQVGLGELAMWSLGRDQEDPAGALSYAEDNSSSHRPDAVRVLGHLQRLHGAFVRRPDGNEGGVRVRDSG